MTFASIRGAAQEAARAGTLLPHQLAALQWIDEQITDAQKQGFTDLWRAKGSPAAPAPKPVATPAGDVANTWEGIEMAARIAGAKFPALVAAQWALESGYGKKPSGKNNFFGLKGFGTKKQTLEEVGGVMRPETASFKDFPTVRACVEYLVSRWYQDFKQHKGVNRAATIEEAAQLLEVEGYATDSQYSEKLLRVLKDRGAKPLAVPAQQPPRPAGIPQPCLRLTRSGRKDGRGLDILNLHRIKNGAPVGVIQVVSGAPGAQAFRTGAASRAGSLEPLPEGRWTIGNIDWAAGKDNYQGSFGPGLGPVWVPLEYAGPGRTARSAVGAHIDANREYNPGSAGCVVFNNLADLKAFVAWLRADDPKGLFVDWGLGTCPKIG